jgi:DNA-binding transcriptional ArsR family regulator
MDETTAIDVLAALSQSTRLRAFRHLVRRHPEPVAAGELARQLDTPHNTMSAHLAVLTRAGLVSVSRRGRSMLYSADLNGFRNLVGFLTRDCCAGRPEICTPVLEALSCAPQPET